MLRLGRAGYFWRCRTFSALGLLCLLHLAAPGRADAYVDPGTSGLMAQVLYILFYSGMALILCFFRHLKSRLTALKEFLTKLLFRARS